MSGKGISASTLKIIAVVCMLIDHLAATVLIRMIKFGNYPASFSDAYFIMRTIGRIAFPIYCFLLIEGFLHTHSRKKYAGRLACFAIISEIPFDLAFHGTILEFSYQNVFFTLLFGLLTVIIYDWIMTQPLWTPWKKTLLGVCCFWCGMIAAEFFETDYGALGILCIMVFYFFRNNRTQQVICGCLSFLWWEWAAVFAFLPIYFYNGKRGFQLKYFFYFFYPLHLLFLYLIVWKLGYGATSAI